MNSYTSIKTGIPDFDRLYPMVKEFLVKDRLDIVVDGQPVRGYRTPDAKSIWIRDVSDMFRGFRYFETDLTSAVDHFAATQAANGRIFDYFTTFPEKLPCEKENWTKYVRVPVEADVEYRFVKAAWLAWQACGDDEWIRGLIPHMEKALAYATTHPWRLDPESGLVKRPYTIDTWDFAYTAGQHDWLQFQINDNTFWGIMHGDNSGYYEAFTIMSRLQAYLGNGTEAATWGERAETLREALNRICWNGRFYTHFVKLTPVTIPGGNESAQLSLSNPMAINRGAATHEMAVSIIEEYRKRGRESGAFAEWFSIDPPFPDGVFGDEKLIAGAYINGGIMPLVGGELALAALEHGFEEYGVDILRRYSRMITETGETYLWYFPDGSASTVETSTSPDAEPTDGWGSSAMLCALMEGLAGVRDNSKGFREITLAPRWPAAGVTRADVSVGYEASGRFISYTIEYTDTAIILAIEADTAVSGHIMLPEGRSRGAATLDGNPLECSDISVEQSMYLDFTALLQGAHTIRIPLLPV